MEMAEVIKRALQEWVLPELGAIRAENAEIKGQLAVTNQRLGDMQARILELNRRIDDVNKRIDINKRIDDVRTDLTARHDRLNLRLDELGRAIVRRDEYERVLRQMEHRLTAMEGAVEDLKRRVA